ncbi:hypothetical protein [Flavobacterium anhuiense]|uniref:hypothetical protein n=1 Tax=Flavobacterium anhuiense TaxID=459526 RepID=UPI001183F3D1|nr:hypothetical protein [Flavobacterium anhuiense]
MCISNKKNHFKERFSTVNFVPIIDLKKMISKGYFGRKKLRKEAILLFLPIFREIRANFSSFMLNQRL